MSKNPARVVAVWCWYHGEHFLGYQTQPGQRTVHGELAAAFQTIGVSRAPVAAGRTDAGVHARMQVLTLRVVEPLSDAELEARLRGALPSDLGVIAVRTCTQRLHAQHHATSKEYRYRICPEPVDAWRPHCWATELDAAALKTALHRFEGTHEFSAFHHHSSAKRPRTVSSIEVRHRAHGLLDVSVTGEGFARYQVRYLIAAAVAVARGEHSLAELDHALRSQASLRLQKAPAAGLILWEVRYPPEIDPFEPTLRALAPGLPVTPPFEAPDGGSAG